MTEVKEQVLYNKIKQYDTYENGVKQGKCWSEVNGKTVAEAFYKDGKLDGPCTSWSMFGQIIEQGQYIGGEKEGLWKEWNDDGTLWKTIEYRDGKRHGDYKIYFTDGTVRHLKYDHGRRIRDTTYIPFSVLVKLYYQHIRKKFADFKLFIQKNKKRKEIRYHTNGNISTIENWLFNKKNGLAQRYYYEGQLWETIHFRNDKANGEYKMWSEDGKLIKHCSFRNDNVIKEWI